MKTSVKHICFGLALLFVITGGLAGCKENKPVNAEKVSYKLAVMVPETGNLAFIGQPMHNALLLAQEENRSKLSADNIDIQLVFADTQGNPREAVTQFGRVADVEKANGIITTLSGVIGAISPIAKDRDILFIGLTPDPTFLKGNSRALRVLFSFDKEGIQLADLMKERQWKKVLILHSTDAATTYEVTKVLLPRLKINGTSATVDTFNVGQRDFKDLVAKYSQDKWDGIVLHGFGSELPFLGEACSIYPNLTSPPKLSPLSTLDVRPELRKNIAGIQFYAPSFLGTSSASYNDFVKRYNNRFPGVTLTYSSVYAYDAYLLLTEALLKSRTSSADKLKEELLSPKQGLTQKYQFDRAGDFQPDTVLLEIGKDGTFEPVK